MSTSQSIRNSLNEVNTLVDMVSAEKISECVIALSSWRRNREMKGYDTKELTQAIGLLAQYRSFLQSVKHLGSRLNLEVFLRSADEFGSSNTVYRIKKKLVPSTERSRYRCYET